MNTMLIGLKDAAKLIGITVIAFCAVLVCTMFLNYNLDLIGIEEEITSEQVMLFYRAQISTAKVVSAVSGGCLLITSAVMLFFYIKHYIDTHKKELGILKALGYSNLNIAKEFWGFGISVFGGALLGFCGAFLMMPSFYRVQNADQILPDIAVHFHVVLLIGLVLLPTAFFVLLSIGYAFYKLKGPVLGLLKESFGTSDQAKKQKPDKGRTRSFLEDLAKSNLRKQKVLVFFILFASFCFSSMTQMSFQMKELASVMMGAMMMLIGIVLAFTTFLIAVTTVIKSNTKTLAMMRVFGYSHKECKRAILGVYRPVSYLGFAIGTVYQYALLRIMVEIVFREIEGVPAYEFDFPAMCISLIAFLITYEVIMYAYSKRLKKVSVKEIMLE